MSLSADSPQSNRKWYSPVQVLSAAKGLYEVFGEHLETKREFQRVGEGRAVALMVLGMFAGTKRTRFLQYSDQRTPDYYTAYFEPNPLGLFTQYWDAVEVVELGSHTKTDDLIAFLAETKLTKGYGEETTLLCDITKAIEKLPPVGELHEKLKDIKPPFHILYLAKISKSQAIYRLARIWPIADWVDFIVDDALANYPQPDHSALTGRFAIPPAPLTGPTPPLDHFQVFGLIKEELEIKLQKWNGN